MRISLIAAVAENRAIGKDGDLPWPPLKQDMRWFRETTMGHHVVMGRRTWESFPGALPGRRVMVLSRSAPDLPEDVALVGSLEEAVETARRAGEEELFVAGGAGVYAAALPLADRLYLTRVHGAFDADTCFPEYDDAAWRIVREEHRPADERHPWALTFLVLDRKGFEVPNATH